MACLCSFPQEWGLAGGLMGALLPVSFLTELRSVEMVTAALFMIAAIFTLRTWRSKSFRLTSGLRDGLIWGLGLLTNAALLSVLIAWTLLAFWLWPSRWKQITTYAFGVFGAVTLVLAPWVIRNEKTLGYPIAFRSNFGLELHVSNNENARAQIEDNARGPGYRMYHPSMSLEQARRVIELGEVAYNREQKRAAYIWIRENPFNFGRLTALRVVQFWFPLNPLRPYQSPILWLITCLGIGGLFSIARTDRQGAVFISGIWLSFPVIYYVMQSSMRYRLPLQWSFLLLAGAPLTAIIRRLTSWTEGAAHLAQR
jgi:hypothetical protein